MSKVWFKQDDKFFLPKACLNFEFFRSVRHELNESVTYRSRVELRCLLPRRHTTHDVVVTLTDGDRFHGDGYEQ